MTRNAAEVIAERVMSLLEDSTTIRERSGGWDLQGNPFHSEVFVAWSPTTLDRGLAGLALALNSTDPRGVKARYAHRYLTEMVQACKTLDQPMGGLYHGVGALAFSTLIASEATNGYLRALEGLDEKVCVEARTMLGIVELSAPARSMGVYDAISGLSGLGRYLLARGDRGRPVLERILAALSAMSRPVTHAGRTVPGLWVEGPPFLDAGPLPAYEHGHLNLGLAHGISGPLALLSLAWRAGVRVENQQEAITELTDLLLRWRGRDGHGSYWPAVVTFQEWVDGEPSPAKRQRPGWCYGTPGVARAVQLAGLALGREDWCEAARDAVLSELALPYAQWGVSDAGLCHGWAGNLVVLQLMNDELKDARISAAIDDIAQLIVSEHSERHPFGFRFPVQFGLETGGSQNGVADYPGFLNGAAGVALALDHYAHPVATPPTWTAALLIA